jgi:hypothetical protein
LKEQIKNTILRIMRLMSLARVHHKLNPIPLRQSDTASLATCFLHPQPPVIVLITTCYHTGYHLLSPPVIGPEL